jgi:hypothetical protein
MTSWNRRCADAKRAEAEAPALAVLDRAFDAVSSQRAAKKTAARSNRAVVPK